MAGGKGLLVHNRKAGSSDSGPSVADFLESLPPAKPVEYPEDWNDGGLMEMERPPWVAVAGGDGTVESVARLALKAEIPLGVIPRGTFNNFAKSLGLPADPLEACRLIGRGNPHPVDVGFVGDHAFFECAGAGIDAALFPASEAIKSGAIRRWVDVMDLAFRYRRHHFELRFDRPLSEALCHNTTNESSSLLRHFSRRGGRALEIDAAMVTISNGPYFGMNFTVAPEERMDDGHFTVTIFHRYSKAQLARHFLSIMGGRREYCPKAIAFRVQRVQVGARHGEVPVHLDGTPHSLWPLEAVCRPGALKVFLPG